MNHALTYPCTSSGYRSSVRVTILVRCLFCRLVHALFQASGRDVSTILRPGSSVNWWSKVWAAEVETPSSRESATAKTFEPLRRTKRRILSRFSPGSAASTSFSKPTPSFFTVSASVVNTGISTNVGSIRGSRSRFNAASAASRAKRSASQVFPEPGPASTASSHTPSKAWAGDMRVSSSLISSDRSRHEG